MESTTEELLLEAKDRLADIAIGARMMLEVTTGASRRYAAEVLRVATACLDPRCGDEGRLCDACSDKAAKDHRPWCNGPMEGTPEYDQQLRDAGRGHLIRP